VFEPPGYGKPLDHRPLRESLLELRRDHRVTLIYDPLGGGETFVENLKREHGFDSPAAAHGQGPKQMALAASRLLEAINNGWLKHDGDETLRQHALNAVALPVGGEGIRFGRPPGPRVPIDALVALAMAHSVAVAEAPSDWSVSGPPVGFA
jgi:phage terminase large subunit-like protein